MPYSLAKQSLCYVYLTIDINTNILQRKHQNFETPRKENKSRLVSTARTLLICSPRRCAREHSHIILYIWTRCCRRREFVYAALQRGKKLKTLWKPILFSIFKEIFKRLIVWKHFISYLKILTVLIFSLESSLISKRLFLKQFRNMRQSVEYKNLNNHLIIFC